MDSSEVKQYVEALQELKINSKPHINTLTQIAHENMKQYYKEIVHAIEERIRTVTFCFPILIILLGTSS